jgi:tellurite resistance-related uncharacterized protein
VRLRLAGDRDEAVVLYPSHRGGWETPGDLGATAMPHDLALQSLRALLSAHETKGGAWALIHVLEGKLRYCIEAPASETILEPGQPGVIQPQVPHHVEPVGLVRFYLEFHRTP